MSWIQTAGGGRFDLEAPRAADVALADVAHALSNLCRFNGHCRSFYSVAQHSVLVADALFRFKDREVARAGLLHDAAEAYLGDVARPLKRIVGSVYERLEREVLARVYEALELPWPDDGVWALVKREDVRALMTERRDLLPPPPAPWFEDEAGIEPWEKPIVPLAPADARDRFLWTAAALGLGGVS